MNESPADSLAWSPRKLATVIVIAVLVQLALISWFSAEGPLRPRTAESRPAIQLLAEAREDWLALSDPTLFARPNPAGFSGAAWLRFPNHSYVPADTAAAPLWLALAPETLGTTFQKFVRTYATESRTLRSWQPPSVTAPTRLPVAPAFDSQVTPEGPLAARGIIDCPKLPSWTNSDVLAPSRVQVLVDARGNPVSAVLLGSSGLPAADQSALEIAARMRFGPEPTVLRNPAAGPEEGLTTGSLHFSWHTLAPSTTNGLVNPR